MHIQERLEFLDSLPALPIKPALPGGTIIQTLSTDKPIDPNKDGGTVGPEMINIYLAGVSEQNRKDVDNCKLLVQNAADKMYDPINEMYEWFKYYANGLTKLGWVVQASQMKEQVIKQTGLTMDVVAIHVIQSLIQGDAQKLLGLSKQALENIKGDGNLINLYNRKANVGHDAKFDMSPVWQTAEGSPMMILNCNSLNVKESTKGILFWKSTSQETAIKTAAQAVYLNTEIYGGLRDEVLKKLGQAGKDWLGDLPDFG